MISKVGEIIKQARGNVSLRSFADKCGVSHTIIDTYEKGYDPRTQKPIRHTVDTLTKIAVGAQISLEKLLNASVEDMSDLDLHEKLTIKEIVPSEKLANNLGKRLKNLRGKTNLTQNSIAERIGMAQSTYSLYELDQREPSFEVLKSLADVFNVSIDYLLGRTEEKNPAHGEIIITPASSPEDEFAYDIEIKGEPEISDYDKRIINILMKQLPTMSEAKKKNMIPFIQSLIMTIRNSDDN